MISLGLERLWEAERPPFLVQPLAVIQVPLLPCRRDDSHWGTEAPPEGSPRSSPALISQCSKRTPQGDELRAWGTKPSERESLVGGGAPRLTVGQQRVPQTEVASLLLSRALRVRKESEGSQSSPHLTTSPFQKRLIVNFPGKIIHTVLFK